MTWQFPVVNRNEWDVAHRNDRGTVNAAAMNRINQNLKTLADAEGLSLSVKTSYVKENFIYDADFATILRNVATLLAHWKKKYPVPNAEWYELNLPETMALHFDVFNRVERLILRMYRVTPRFKTIEEMYAGEIIGVL